MGFDMFQSIKRIEAKRIRLILYLKADVFYL